MVVADKKARSSTGAVQGDPAETEFLRGKKNPEVTECRVQTALGALIPCWWLDQRPAAKLLVRTAEEIRQNQHKNAEARQSHIKRTRERLRELGIKLTEIPRCR